MRGPPGTGVAALGFAQLARVVRTWSDEVATSERGDACAWSDLERALRKRVRSARRQRFVGMTAAAAFAAFAVLVTGQLGGFDRKVTFVVADGALLTTDAGGPSSGQEVGTRIQGRRADAAARLSFSDGSDVVLHPGARGLVLGTTARGARVRLEQGRARFAVAHRARTDWAVEAGPYVVLVHGTVFDVDWSLKSGALAVDLVSGVITVRGPVPGGEITLQSGQRLTALASTGQGRIGSLEDRAPDSRPGAARAAVQPTAPSPLASSASVGEGSVVKPASSSVGERLYAARAGGGAAPTGGRYSSADGGAARVLSLSASWEARVASGGFQSVVGDADSVGVERCLAEAPVGSLSALADAARYVRRTDLARRALLAERRRFPSTRAAHDAAFLIGRLAEDAAGDTREALLWYDRYLEEGAQGTGTYASEALGRKMLALSHLRESADARSTAESYVRLYPDGAFASRARRLLAQDTEQPLRHRQ